MTRSHEWLEMMCERYSWLKHDSMIFVLDFFCPFLFSCFFFWEKKSIDYYNIDIVSEQVFTVTLGGWTLWEWSLQMKQPKSHAIGSLPWTSENLYSEGKEKSHE